MGMLKLVKKRIAELENDIVELQAKNLDEAYKQGRIDRIYKAINFNIDLLKATGEWEADVVSLNDYRK